jgi:hypothetical protein
MVRADKGPRRGEEDVVSTPHSSGGVVETHPAFGVAVVTLGSGSSRSLFQSDVLHHQSITLRIETADRKRHLNHDNVHPGKTLVEVEMSLAQWGALVSSIGVGSGVPVTIRRTESEQYVPTLPYRPRIQTSLDEVHDSINKLLARARETLSAVEDAFENKKGVRAMRDALRAHSGSITHAAANSEFAVTSAAAAGENIVAQVRADIESQVVTAIRATGGQGEINVPEVSLGELEAATPEMETCRLCCGGGRIATGPWGVNPSKVTCPECLGKKTLPEDHHYQDPTI